MKNQRWFLQITEKQFAGGALPGVRSKSRLARALGLVLVVLAMPWHYVYGQSGCPFPDSVAVADTLDPRGYYPTQVGNIWEYIVENGPFIEELQREEIVADTLIDGITWFKKRQIRFKYDPFAPISQAITDIKSERFSYFFIIDGGEVFWTEQGLDTMLVGFDRPFNSCYEDRSLRFLDSLSRSGFHGSGGAVATISCT